jgi:hypothetical protein
VHSLSSLELSQLSAVEFLEILKPLGVQEPLNPNSNLTVAQTAKLLGVHTDTVRRNYAHIFDRLSPGRIGIRVRTLFEEIEKQKSGLKEGPARTPRTCR